jgi:PadR family transcriptional regulator AphA
MSRKLSELSSTSYAILGLLAIRPWSTYELAKQMRRDLHFVWPRAESNLYAEPKRLVTLGLASAEAQPQGRRRRTVYAITPAGQTALRDWLDQPAAAPRFESESLVKILFSNNGSREQLLRHLHDVRDHARTRRDELADIFRPYLEHAEPYPERTHINILTATAVLTTASAEAAWADWAIHQVKRWPSSTTPDDPDSILEALRGLISASPGTTR